MLAVVRRNPRFRRLWFAQVVSQLGDWFNRVAVLTLLGELGANDAAIGLGALFALEMALRLIPSTVLGTVAGSVADRLPRRLLMISADLARACVVLGLLTIREPSQLPLLYALLFAQMAIGIFFEAARNAATPSTVDRKDLHAAFALSSATWSLMLTIGALLGGSFVSLVGVRGVFLMDAATYVLSALILIGLPIPWVRAEQRFTIGDLVFLRDIRRGLAHVRERRILPYVFTKASWGGAGGFLVVLAISGRTRFGADGGSDTISVGLATGLLYAARGFGTAVGPILGRRFIGSSDFALRSQISGGYAVAALGYFGFSFVNELPLALALVAFAHLGGSALWVSSTTYWQRYAEDAFRGRVYAMELMGMTLAASLGGLAAGLLYDATGSLETTVRAVCGLVLVAGSAWSVIAWRSARRLGSEPGGVVR